MWAKFTYRKKSLTLWLMAKLNRVIDGVRRRIGSRRHWTTGYLFEPKSFSSSHDIGFPCGGNGGGNGGATVARLAESFARNSLRICWNLDGCFGWDSRSWRIWHGFKPRFGLFTFTVSSSWKSSIVAFFALSVGFSRKIDLVRWRMIFRPSTRGTIAFFSRYWASEAKASAEFLYVDDGDGIQLIFERSVSPVGASWSVFFGPDSLGSWLCGKRSIRTTQSRITYLRNKARRYCALSVKSQKI